MGVVGGKALLDLNYEEDSKAKVDMNLVMTGGGKYVELQGTGEESPFDRQELDQLLSLGEQGILQMIERQKRCSDRLQTRSEQDVRGLGSDVAGGSGCYCRYEE